jgi:arsenate reductase
MDFILTVCHEFDDDDCPTWPGGPMTARWDIEDPAVVAGSEGMRLLAFTTAYRELLNRVRIFANLSFESLDRLSLVHRVSEIGKGG